MLPSIIEDDSSKNKKLKDEINLILDLINGSQDDNEDAERQRVDFDSYLIADDDLVIPWDPCYPRPDQGTRSGQRVREDHPEGPSVTPERPGVVHGFARSRNRRSHGVQTKPQVREPPEGVRVWRQGGGKPSRLVAALAGDEVGEDDMLREARKRAGRGGARGGQRGPAERGR